MTQMSHTTRDTRDGGSMGPDNDAGEREGEWTEVPAGDDGRPAYRYRPPGVGSPEWEVEVNGAYYGEPQTWSDAVDDYAFVAGMEAAHQERRNEPCHIYEYDGAFRCTTHDRQWGAITNPDEPCMELEPSCGGWRAAGSWTR